MMRIIILIIIYLAGGDGLSGHEEIRVDILDIPAKVFTVKSLSQGFPLRHISVVSLEK